MLPGTALAQNASSLGLVRDEAAPFLVRGSPTFPPADLEKARRLKSACDELYTRRKAASWFLVLTGPLGLRPSKVFEEFNRAFDPGSSAACDFSGGLDREPGWPATENFLAGLYRGLGREELLPAVRSWLRVCEALEAIAGGNEEAPLQPGADDLGPDARLVISPGLEFVRLDYLPEDLETVPELGVEAFVSSYGKAPGSWLVYDGGDEPVFEPLEAEEAAFFAVCDGKVPLRDFPGYGGEAFTRLLERISASGAVRANEKKGG